MEKADQRYGLQKIPSLHFEREWMLTDCGLCDSAVGVINTLRPENTSDLLKSAPTNHRLEIYSAISSKK